MVVSRDPQCLPMRQIQDFSPEYPLTQNGNMYFVGLMQSITFRAVLNLARQINRQIVRLHPLEPHIGKITSPTNLHTSPIYLHETTMQPEAVMFTTQDQQAFHESEQSNGVLFLTPDGRIVPSESTLDAQPPHPEPKDAIMINDPAMREHCDGPNLADEIIP